MNHMTQVASSHSASMHAVAVAGASGRMGHMLIEAIANAPDCRLTGALDLASSPAVGTDAGAAMGKASGVLVTGDLKQGLQNSHYLIDFTRPEGTLAHLKICQALGVKAVIGTTGFSDAEKNEIKAIAKDVAIVMAPNMSVGVNVTLKLLEMAAKALATGYDIEIIEAHHRHKVDAPSGTALKMGEVIADALGRDLKDCAVYAREGVTGERDPSSIGFATIRGGDIVGDHTVLFAGTGERAMSVSTWVVIFWRLNLLRRVKLDVPQSTAAFWQAAQFDEAHARVAQFDRDQSVTPLLEATLLPLGGTLAAAGEREHQLTRVLRDSLQATVNRLQWGQLLLATVGAISPFVGLLGTVWGIFNALSGMAEVGQITLDRVAGPVGEALVMTAAGLAVAIPAVLAYNVLGRTVAQIEIELEGFAQDLMNLLTGRHN